MNFPRVMAGSENPDQEFDYMIDSVGGAANDLKGTFFRNGPGRQCIGDTKYGHWFDGDGMIAAFTFNEGQVHFKTSTFGPQSILMKLLLKQFVIPVSAPRSRGGLQELFKMPANPANTSIIHHGGHLLALNEGGKPWALEPATLDTIGEFRIRRGRARTKPSL